MKKVFLIVVIATLSLTTTMGQSLEKMNWENEPEKWEIVSPTELTMDVTPISDVWAVTQGFTVDDAPFYYGIRGGEFEVKVKVSGVFKSNYDQAGLMIKADHKNWVKCGFEFVKGETKLSTVVAREASDWSILELKENTKSIWLKAVRRLNTIYITYSYDDKEYKMVRTFFMPDNTPLKVGVMGASPEGNGFVAKFEHFKVKHLADLRRLEWIERQKSVEQSME